MMISTAQTMIDNEVAEALKKLLPPIDGLTIGLLLIVIGLLVAIFCWVNWLKRRYRDTIDPAMVRVFNRRIVAWLTIYVLLGLTVFWGPLATLCFFLGVSFWALREFVTMTPTRRADHRTLFWVFFVFVPLQYILAAYSGDRRWFIAFAVLIPVYGSLFISARIAFAGEAQRFLERTAKIQFGLLICIYALSHAPALLYLDLIYYDTASGEYRPWDQTKSRLLFFLVLMVQLSDLLQFFWDRLYGRNLIAAPINSTKSWEGLIGAAICCGAAALILQWLTGITPFTTYGAAIMGMVISLMAISGTMTMSAIKRDRGVSDYGTLVQGHAGVLDRIDAICFAAPIFYHLTRFFLGAAVAD